MVLFDDNTFEEIRSFQFKWSHLWILGGVVLLINAIISIGIISFKPLVNSLQHKSTESSQIIELRRQVLDFENILNSQQLYITNLQKIMTGELDSFVLADSVVESQTEIVDSSYFVERIAEDEQLRQEVELESQLNVDEYAQLHVNNPNPRSIEYLYLLPPVDGVISLGFDPRRNHLGLDINAPANSSIKAVLSGHIIYAGWTLETGNTIGIQHENNLISFYKHNSALLKKQGTYVNAGEAIAIIGNTGTLSSGPHLHFELWLDGKPVNPEDYINF